MHLLKYNNKIENIPSSSLIQNSIRKNYNEAMMTGEATLRCNKVCDLLVNIYVTGHCIQITCSISKIYSSISYYVANPVKLRNAIYEGTFDLGH